MLERIRALSAMLPRQQFTKAEIVKATDIAPGTVGQIIGRGQQGGFIEQVGTRPRAPGSPGGAPEFIYRIVPGEPARQLGAELDQSMRALLPGVAADLPGEVPETLLIAESKLSDGLLAGASAMRSAYDAGKILEMNEAAEDFSALFTSIGPELAAATRVVRSSSPHAARLRAARDAFDQARSVVGAIRGNQPLDPQQAEAAALIGASHAASLAAQRDPCFAGSASLRWGGRLACRMIDQLDRPAVGAQEEGIRLANRFMQVVGPSSAPGVVVIDGIGDDGTTVRLMRDALAATGVRSVNAAAYSPGTPLGCRLVVLGDGDPSSRAASALTRAALEGVHLCVIDETSRVQEALTVPAHVEYYSLPGRTPGDSARRLFDVAAAVRAEVCAPLGSPRRHSSLSSFDDGGATDPGTHTLSAYKHL